MDLSKNPETDSTSEMEEDDEDEETTSSENDNNNPKSIPSSFSIRNLSKPHIAEAGQASTLTTQGLTQGQVSEMREYAMNTMRELLGIYGLTSEVAESISRQLPIAAFSSGEFVCNFCLMNQTAALEETVIFLIQPTDHDKLIPIFSHRVSHRSYNPLNTSLNVDKTIPLLTR